MPRSQMVFCSDRRPELKAEQPELPFGELSKVRRCLLSPLCSALTALHLAGGRRRVEGALRGADYGYRGTLAFVLTCALSILQSARKTACRMRC